MTKVASLVTKLRNDILITLHGKYSVCSPPEIIVNVNTRYAS